MWMGLLQAARLPYQPTGSLHVAYHADELEVIREFCELGPVSSYLFQSLDARGVEARTQAVLSAGLLGDYGVRQRWRWIHGCCCAESPSFWRNGTA